MIQDELPYQLQERLDKIKILIQQIESGEKVVQNKEKVLYFFSILCTKLQYKIEKLIEQQVEDDLFYSPNF